VTTAPALVSIESLCKTYRGAHRPALAGVSLEIQAGTCFGLLGPNGAGKTTLISILTGILAADSGRARLQKASSHWVDCGIGSTEAGELIGLVPQELAFYPTLTVRENLCYFGAMRGLRGDALRRRTDASLAIGRLEPLRHQRAETLSGGLQRRLNLAIGVIHTPRLLVLDEPTVGVDAQSRLFILEELARLKAAGTTILYTSHYLDEAQQLCDALAVMDHGRVVAQGQQAELLQDELVTMRLRSAPTPAFLQALSAIPTVRDTRQAGLWLALVSRDPAATLSAALEVARGSGTVIAEASMGKRSLEALFFQLTGTQLRDEGNDASAD
jgi:ABC-2 type transport system ATP-binding protein